MEITKKIRVCDECGKELGDKSRRIAGADGFTCIVCGKEFCRDHIGGSLEGADYACCSTYFLCPEHYKQVKEFIGGLKPEGPWYRAWLPEHGEYYIIHDDKGKNQTYIDPLRAKALYDCMRRERGKSD